MSAEIAETLIYKGGFMDIFVFSVDRAISDNSFNTGTKKKSEEGIKGDCRKYFLNSKGFPVYCDDYLFGFDGKLNSRTFYFRSEDNCMIGKVEYNFIPDQPRPRYYRTEVNEYDEDGRMLSYIWYDSEHIKFAEKYEYSDERLIGCSKIEGYYPDIAIGSVSDEDEDDFFSEKNPSGYSRSEYMYDDSGAIVKYRRYTVNSEDKIFNSESDVKPTIYKTLKKKKLI